MSDRVLVPLPDGRWLALAPDAFREALEAGSVLIAAPGAPAAVTSEALVDAGELAKKLFLPKSCVYEQAKTGAIPSVRVGKHVRFDTAKVLAALNSTASVAGGRS